MNNEVSALEFVNPSETMKVQSLLYQARGACLRPYNDLFTLQT